MGGTDSNRIKELLLDALDRAPAERARYLDSACGGDAGLRARVEALIEAHEGAGELLGDDDETPGPPALQGLALRALTDLDLGPGDLVGDYRLEEELGEGGFGRVFRAEQLRPVQRQVALKVMKLGLDSKPVMARFETERQVLARMEHPHIARVLDAGVGPHGRPFIVMELVAGKPITAYCQRLALRERLALFRQVCLAIHHAHVKGILHRDIKPNNVLVTEVDGAPQPRVIDFGVAKALEEDALDGTRLTAAGHLVGTPAYMSPEQLDSATDMDTRSDVYGLGVLLYELVAGTTPFTPEGTGVAALVDLRRRIREQDPPPPSRASPGEGAAPGDVPREVDWICLRAIEGDPDRRYPSAFALAADIDRLLAGLPVEAAPASATYRLRKLVARHRAASLFAGAALLALVLGAGGTVLEMVRAERLNVALGDALELAEGEAQEARAQSDIAEAVNAFLTEDLLQAARPSIVAGRGHDVLMSEVLDAAARSLDDASGPDGRFAGKPRVEGRVRYAIGQTYLALGRGEEAAVQLERALELLKSDLGERHPEVLRCTVDLARARQDEGEYAEADALLADGLPVLREVLGPGDAATLGAIQTLATTARLSGREDESGALYEQGLQMAREAGTEHSPAALGLLGGLAIHETEVGRLDEAERLYREVIDIRCETLGEDAPSTLTARSNHAIVLLRAGRSAEALAELEEAVPDMRRVLGDRHPDTLASMRNLACAHIEVGHAEESFDIVKALYDEALERRGPDHAETLWTMDILAMATEARGDFDEARRLMYDLVERSERLIGPDHPLTANRLTNLSILLLRNGRFDEAEPCIRRALELNDALHGREDPRSVEHLQRLAQVFRERNDDAEAERLLEEALERGAGAPGATPQVVLARRELCLLLRDQARWEEALEVIDVNLAELEQAHGAEDERYLACAALTLDTLVHAGRLDRARELEASILPYLEGLRPEDPGSRLLRPPPPD